eukprot:3447934-Amphidinium_carterae.1
MDGVFCWQGEHVFLMELTKRRRARSRGQAESKLKKPSEGKSRFPHCRGDIERKQLPFSKATLQFLSEMVIGFPSLLLGSSLPPAVAQERGITDARRRYGDFANAAPPPAIPSKAMSSKIADMVPKKG